jgi:hypothetical protein
MKYIATVVFLLLTVIGLGAIIELLGHEEVAKHVDLLRWLIGLTVFFALCAVPALIPELGRAIADVVRAWRGKNGSTP